MEFEEEPVKVFSGLEFLLFLPSVVAVLSLFTTAPLILKVCLWVAASVMGYLAIVSMRTKKKWLKKWGN